MTIQLIQEEISKRELSKAQKNAWKKYFSDRQNKIIIGKDGAAANHLIYALLRGANVEKAFSKNITEKRIKSNAAQGKNPRHGLCIAVYNSGYILKNAIKQIEKTNKSEITIQGSEYKFPSTLEQITEILEKLDKINTSL